MKVIVKFKSGMKVEFKNVDGYFDWGDKVQFFEKGLNNTSFAFKKDDLLQITLCDF